MAEATVAPTGEVDTPIAPVVENAAEQAVQTDSEEITSLDDLEPDPQIMSLDGGVEEPEVEDEPDTAQEAEEADTAAGEEDVDAAEGAEGGDEDDGEAEDAEPEMLEFSFGGNKVEFAKDSVAPELVEKIDQFTKGIWSDYTNKSQGLAERNASLTGREETVAKLAALNGEALTTYSRGLQLRADIEQLSKFDMNALWTSDPDTARQISDQLAEKQAEFQTTLTQVSQMEENIAQSTQTEIDKRTVAGTELLNNRIPDFSTKHAADVVTYAIEEFGLPKEEAVKWAMNPNVTQMCYESMLYRRMQSKVKNSQPKPNSTKPVRAAKNSRSAVAGTTRDPDKMSMSQLSKYLELAPR